MTIEWYQECLANSTRYHKEQLEYAMEKFQTALLGIAQDEFKQVQIDEAISQHKNGFDDDKFMKSARLKAMEEAKQRITAQVCQLKAASIHLRERCGKCCAESLQIGAARR